MQKFLTNKNRRHSGFTLIELLVVIAIIGLLSSVVLASLNSARAKAKDAKRKSELQQIVRALEFYYDEYGAYPPHRPSNTCGGFRPDWSTSYCTESNWLTTDSNFLKFINLPKDPSNVLVGGGAHSDDTPWWFALTYTYGVTADGQKYDLLTNLENISDPERCEFKLWRSVAIWPTDTGCYSSALPGNVPDRAKQIWAPK
jgi:prepilin-type N-terminal cleavage/methylation domain-containing protein